MEEKEIHRSCKQSKAIETWKWVGKGYMMTFEFGGDKDRFCWISCGWWGRTSEVRTLKIENWEGKEEESPLRELHLKNKIRKVTFCKCRMPKWAFLTEAAKTILFLYALQLLMIFLAFFLQGCFGFWNLQVCCWSLSQWSFCCLLHWWERCGRTSHRV